MDLSTQWARGYPPGTRETPTFAPEHPRLDETRRVEVACDWSPRQGRPQGPKNLGWQNKLAVGER